MEHPTSVETEQTTSKYLEIFTAYYNKNIHPVLLDNASICLQAESDSIFINMDDIASKMQSITDTINKFKSIIETHDSQSLLALSSILPLQSYDHIPSINIMPVITKWITNSIVNTGFKVGEFYNDIINVIADYITRIVVPYDNIGENLINRGISSEIGICVNQNDIKSLLDLPKKYHELAKFQGTLEWQFLVNLIDFVQTDQRLKPSCDNRSPASLELYGPE